MQKTAFETLVSATSSLYAIPKVGFKLLSPNCQWSVSHPSTIVLPVWHYSWKNTVNNVCLYPNASTPR